MQSLSALHGSQTVGGVPKDVIVHFFNDSFVKFRKVLSD